MDAISKLFNNYFDWAGALAPIHFRFLLRALLVFGLPCLFCGWAFMKGSRSVLIQALCFSFGFLLAAMIPVEHLVTIERVKRGWILLFGSVLLLSLPSILPTLVVPQLGLQKKLRVIGYLTLGVLFLTNLILS